MGSSHAMTGTRRGWWPGGDGIMIMGEVGAFERGAESVEKGRRSTSHVEPKRDLS